MHFRRLRYRSTRCLVMTFNSYTHVTRGTVRVTQRRNVGINLLHPVAL